MTERNQRTVAGEISLNGHGVHSGAESELTFRPSPPGSGIRFRRLDLDGTPEVPADLEHVVGTDLGTSLGRDGVRILTVEHVLAALSATGITNATIDLSGPEPPIRDGSFRDFLAALTEVGAEEQEAPVRTIRVHEPVTVEGKQGETYACVPGERFRISATIEFSHPAIRRQYGSFVVDRQGFASEIGPARTFGFREEAEELRRKGLARGASLENTIVLDSERVLNDELRFPDEFLRHKVGDIVGDLALLGGPVEGHVVAERPSHSANVALARKLAEEDRKSGSDRPIVDAQKILEYLPHRYPMLLVDRVIDFESGKRIVGLKNVTINEPFFQGHYPGHPIMPGVLVIEAMAQVGGLLLMDTVENPEEKVVYFMSLNNVKWRRPVTPGDQLIFELELVQLRRQVCKMRGEGFVDGNLVAEADLMARIVDR